MDILELKGDEIKDDNKELSRGDASNTANEE
jgi:hypothetical protein